MYGTSGECFNKQFHNSKLHFHQMRDRFSHMDKACSRQLAQELGGPNKTKGKGNTLMVNMKSFESFEVRSPLEAHRSRTRFRGASIEVLQPRPARRDYRGRQDQVSSSSCPQRPPEAGPEGCLWFEEALHQAREA